jgi:indole-3-acetate monooxygenase
MNGPTRDAANDARALRDLILENREATEQNRQVAEPIVDALIASNLGRMALPREYGGLDVPPTEGLEALEALAEAEAAVAWIVWNSSLPCWFSRFLPEEVRKDVFNNPRPLFTSSTRPSGRARLESDRYIVSGRWSLVSGCMHASWIPVMCLVEKDGQVEMRAPNAPHMRMLFVPRDKHEILDTWYAGGLRGTGSHDSVLRDVSVPADYSFTFGDPSRMDTPMGRVPIFATMSAGGAAICLGVATASLQALLDLAANKMSLDAGPSLRDRTPVQSLVARTDTKLKSLRDRLASSLSNLWQRAQAGLDRDLPAMADVVGASVSSAIECRAAVSEIYAAAGVSALYTDGPLERAHRDIHAVAQHIALQPHWLEQAGRVRLGLKPTHPLFML